MLLSGDPTLRPTALERWVSSVPICYMNTVGGHHSSLSPSGFRMHTNCQVRRAVDWPMSSSATADLPRSLHSRPRRFGSGLFFLALVRESEVGVPSFYLPAMNCVVLGKALASVCTSASSPACQPLSPGRSKGVRGQPWQWLLWMEDLIGARHGSEHFARTVSLKPTLYEVPALVSPGRFSAPPLAHVSVAWPWLLSALGPASQSAVTTD